MRVNLVLEPDLVMRNIAHGSGVKTTKKKDGLKSRTKRAQGVHKGNSIGEMIDVLLQVTQLISQVPQIRVQLLQLIFKNPDQL